MQNLNPIEEYKKRVKELGIFRIMQIETKNVKTIKKIWEEKGIAWVVEEFDTEYKGDVEFKILNLYYDFKWQGNKLAQEIFVDNSNISNENTDEFNFLINKTGFNVLKKY